MEVLVHSFFESLRLLPNLFLIYLLIEYIEHKNNNVIHHLFMKSRKTGPLLGGVFGCIPQCGFSVIGSELYSKKAVTLGTLVAIFVSTSDEAIPILIAEPSYSLDLLKLIGIKLLVAVIAGLFTDFFVRIAVSPKGCEHAHTDHHHFHGNCEDCHDGIVKSAIIHSIRIFVFIFVVSVVLGYFIEYMGDTFETIAKMKWLQPFVTPLVGLIPNCAASVVLTKLYIAGGITLGSLIGGLCAGSGIGLIVLFRLNKSKKENIRVVLLMYGIGVVTSLILNAFGV